MRTNWILSTAALAVCVTAAAAAQSATTPMASKGKGDTMNVTYTGCLESVNHGAAFLLTRVGGTESMHDDMAMKHDDTAMKDEGGGKRDAMPSKSFALVGSANLSKHIGQKVSVTGSLSDGSMGTMRQDVSTLTVKTLKVVAKSCA